MFATMLRYKLAERGGELVEVDPAYTSQTCACCGHVSKASRVSQSAFVCVGCGHEAQADINAAHNIVRAGLARRASQASHISGRQEELSTDVPHGAT